MDLANDEQIWGDSLFQPMTAEEKADLKKQCDMFEKYLKEKRNWENAFQRWSDKEAMDGTTPYGCCGYGSMCDYCKDNHYGRPCVRALNEMVREKHLQIDYSKRDFEEIWRGW